MGQLDVLCVGDVVTDAFIELFDDRAVSYENDLGKWLAIPFGTKIPFKQAKIVEAVGNAANAAVSMTRLGLSCGFVTNVGDDKYGRGIIAALRANRVDTRFVRVNPNKVSNYHYVLWYKDERTILINHEEYEYMWPNFRSKEAPRWIYFSSIAKNALDGFQKDFSDWLEENPDVKLAFQPGTFQLEAGRDRMARLYKRSDVVLMNREEAVQVTGGNFDDLHDLINRLHELGSKIVVVTDGPAGAYASDGNNRFKMPLYPDPKPPYERTGAGDAFSSAFVAAIAKGSSIEDALRQAPINSMNVVQHIGAQEGLLNEQQIDELLRKAPEWYHPERF